MNVLSSQTLTQKKFGFSSSVVANFYNSTVLEFSSAILVIDGGVVVWFVGPYGLY